MQITSRARVAAALAATASLIPLTALDAPRAGATPATTATPIAAELTFSLPAIGGVEFPPDGSVPGGSFQPTVVTARPAMRTLQYPPPPAAVTFSVANPAPYHYQYAYRYVSVSWRNLRTGKTGHTELRHWRTDSSARGYPSSLRTSAVAATGSGPVVATVSVLREQYHAPPIVISVIPGLTALDVPN